jgi:hypothetical protein
MAKQSIIRPVGSIDSSLQLLVNLGPALMDPSVVNESDPQFQHKLGLLLPYL